MLGNVFILCAVCVIAADETTTNNVYGTVENILASGYPAEIHHVNTSDGYILEMHRIPYGRDATSNTGDRPVVFVMHGLMGASNAFIALGADYSIAYNLVDAGFDVWMGNARGNTYSRYHISINPDGFLQKYTFFDFTWEEIGTHDLPAMIDYALEYTNQSTLHYIGHSQGGTVFLVFLSMRPDYNEKIESAHLLAGVGYQEYFPNEELAASAAMVDSIYSLALAMGIVELYPEFFDNLSPSDGYKTADYCTGDLQQRNMCELFGIQHLVRDGQAIEYLPAGASLKQAAHYGQNIRDKLFRRYHHGRNNINIYGQSEPPLYNISLITADVTMHYTVSDDLLDERDVLAMAADMPNTIARKVARESFLHNDFITALDAKELVTDYIIEDLRSRSFPSVEISTDNYDEVIVVDHTSGPMDDIDINLEDDTGSNSVAAVVINMYLIYLSFISLFI